MASSRPKTPLPVSGSTPRRLPRFPQIRGQRVVRRWRFRMAPDALTRKPKGQVPFWARARRLLWSWWPWAIVMHLGDVTTLDGAGRSGMGAMALVSYLIAPSRSAPYGLDHEFSVDDEEFLATMAGASGVPSPGQPHRDPEQRRCLLPGDARRDRSAELSITIEAYIYWAGEIGTAFAERTGARKAAAGVRVKILLDAIGSASIGDGDPADARGRRLPGRLVQPDPLVHARPIQQPHPPQVADHRRPDRVHRRRRHRRSLARQCAAIRANGATCRSGSRGPAVVPLQTGFAQNWQQTTGELMSGDALLPAASTPAGPLAAQTIMSSPEIGASTVRTMYYLSIVCARESIYIANPYFVPDAVGDRRADRGQAARRRRPDHGVGHPQRQLAGPPEQRAAVRAAARQPASRSTNTTARCCTTRRWWWTRCG